jgi:hypothetical protein
MPQTIRERIDVSQERENIFRGKTMVDYFIDIFDISAMFYTRLGFWVQRILRFVRI